MPPRNQQPIYVCGHRNPDTDAICSAIGHASYLGDSGKSAAIPIRCGDIPARTEWVLEQAKVPAPMFIDDIRVTAGMICRREVVTVGLEDTFMLAYRRMSTGGIRNVPVLDRAGNVHGVLRLLDLLQLLLPPEMAGGGVRKVDTKLTHVARTLQAELDGAPISGDEEEELILLVGASSDETIRRRLENATAEGTINKYVVICGDRPKVQSLAVENRVRCLIVSGGFALDPALRKSAEQNGVVVMRYDEDTASCSTLIRCSRMVKHALNREFKTVANTEIVSEFVRTLPHGQQLFPVVERGTSRLVGVLSSTDLLDPRRVQLAMVDHNEFSQAVKGIEEADVVEVIDHHRIGGDVVSRVPIRIQNEPVGSTSTLVARNFRQANITPRRGIALCLAAGIMSDTLNLHSPTTTSVDEEMLNWLAEVAEIDRELFMREFFSIGSLLHEGTIEQILSTDRKVFEESGFKVSISQIEEVAMAPFEGRSKELSEGLDQLCRDHRYDLGILLVTDIGKQNSIILASGSPVLVENLPFEKNGHGGFFAPGVVSRKKQVFPPVASALRRLAG